jgi:cyclopropane fatty-acyl-phospholipid synthase-like methyltransferase
MKLPAIEPEDVPYGDDWFRVDVVDAWAEAADRIRPWRSQFRDAIAESVASLPAGAQVIELGSGPGFLAERVLERCASLASYSLLDFSEPMLARSRVRVARFVLADFKRPDWIRQYEKAGGSFDCVVSMQAIHELRHKRHVPALYRQLREALSAPGLVLICDHVPLDESEKSAKLYMSADEQLAALSSAGFEDVEVALSIDKLRLYRGRKSSSR